MADTSATLRRVVWELSNWADKHEMLNDFGYGDYLDVIAAGDARSYGVLVANSTGASSTDFYLNYNLEVICIDSVEDDKSDKDRVNSDTIEVIRDLENTVRFSHRWKDFSKVDEPFSYQKVDAFGKDKAYGWIATFTLKVKKSHSICNIQTLMPSYDFESGTITGPVCDPATVKDSAGTVLKTIASGAEGTINDSPFTVNGNAKSSLPAEQTKAIEIVDQDDNTISLTDVTDTANNYKGQATIVTGIAYFRDGFNIYKGSNLIWDLGYYLANTTDFDYSGEGKVPRLDPDDDSLLLTDNEFSNKRRVTNDQGGIVTDGSDGSTANYMIDHFTGLGWYMNHGSPTNESWTDGNATVRSLSVGAYSDFRFCTVKEFNDISLNDGKDDNIFNSYHNWTAIITWVLNSADASNAAWVRWKDVEVEGASRIDFRAPSTTSSVVAGFAVRNHF